MGVGCRCRCSARPARPGTTRSCCRCSTASGCPASAPGRPRKRPDHLIADRAYSHPSTRRALRRRGIAHSIPEQRDQRAHRLKLGSAGGRPPKFDRDRYKQRNVVERCFNRLKQFRALATRYAKRAAYYRATLLLVSTVLWLRA